MTDRPGDARTPAASGGGQDARRPTSGTSRPDASMTLLVETMERPLDPGYAAAARARAAGQRPRGAASRVAYLLVAVLLGLAVTVAVVALRAPQPGVLQARTVLERQITDRQQQADRLARDNADDAAAIAALQDRALASGRPGLVQQLSADGVTSGAVAVTGPGVEVTLEDAPDAVAPDGTVDPDRRVQDSDVRLVVNALWASGAEAVAVNGQRLATTSSVRSAGAAILVDLVAIASPYHVDAIGDPGALRTRFATSSAAAQLQVLGESFGLRSGVKEQAHLELPGTGPSTLRHARPLD